MAQRRDAAGMEAEMTLRWRRYSTFIDENNSQIQTASTQIMACAALLD